MNNTTNNEENLSDAPQADQSLNGIRGWLILPAIGLILGGILGVISLVIILDTYQELSDLGYGGFCSFLIFSQAALLGLTVYAVTQFFNKKKRTPNIMISLYGFNFLSLMLLTVLSPNEAFANEFGTSLVQQAIMAAIWIPYFMNSKRVKATFNNN